MAAQFQRDLLVRLSLLTLVIMMASSSDMETSNHIPAYLWKIQTSGGTTIDKRCSLCPAGHFMVKRCSEKEDTMCAPCAEGISFNDDWNMKYQCQRCRVCAGVFLYKQKCNSTCDAACDCQNGLRCMDTECRRCTRQIIESHIDSERANMDSLKHKGSDDSDTEKKHQIPKNKKRKQKKHKNNKRKHSKQ
ncbi:tumor necrosis factor receptor superfamily member 6B-like [Protopterus annectens]|uniref:tumor necrosis factor receptor superfamily member 6B-like n=1 Tax=Protopterus annectens TaxID=7888 RepID=UPI001CFAF54F|nr:tumor necrosis factor receptor superfamily member 6B-like [Protopterus annectens]